MIKREEFNKVCDEALKMMEDAGLFLTPEDKCVTIFEYFFNNEWI